MKMNKEDIKKIIPHRDPFLFVDEITDYVPMTYAKGIKKFDESMDFFKGHFPEFPVVPGVILVEAMAQVGAIIVLQHDAYKGRIAFFAGANKVKFRRKVLPNDVAVIECSITKMRGNIGIGFGKIYVDNELAAEAEVTFAIQ